MTNDRYVIKATYHDTACPYNGKSYILIKGGYVGETENSTYFIEDTYDIASAKRVCNKYRKNNDCEVEFTRHRLERGKKFTVVYYYTEYKIIKVNTYGL